MEDNWHHVKLFTEEIASLLNKPNKEVRKILTTTENYVVHRFLEEVVKGKSENQDYQMTLPLLGDLIISFDEDNNLSYSFVVSDIFKKKLKSAYENSTSPLITQFSSELKNSILDKFEGDKDDES